MRLRCLDDDADFETQELINAVHKFFTNVAILELKIPFWKLFSTPTWLEYVKALDIILEYVCSVILVGIIISFLLSTMTHVPSNFRLLCSFTSKYTQIALERSKTRKNDNHKELSLLERVLMLDGNENEKTATILALDLFLVGIDTVSVIFRNLNEFPNF